MKVSELFEKNLLLNYEKILIDLDKSEFIIFIKNGKEYSYTDRFFELIDFY